MRPSKTSPILTGEVVQFCFKKAVNSRTGKSRLSVPNAELCDLIAGAIERQKLSLGRQPPLPLLSSIEKQAKSILLQLPVIRSVVQEWHSNAFYSGSINPHDDGLTRIQSVEDSLTTLLQKYDRKRPVKVSWHDLAGCIAAWGMHGWRETGLFPTATNPDGPICLFVHEILQLLGIPKDVSAISEALRGRRGGNRVPKLRGAKVPQ